MELRKIPGFLKSTLAPGGRADELEKPRPRDGLYRLACFPGRVLFRRLRRSYCSIFWSITTG